jgi:hypothetical protein
MVRKDVARNDVSRITGHSTGILGKGTYAPTNIGEKRVTANKSWYIFAAC